MSASGVFWRRSALVLMVLGACLAGCDDGDTIIQGGVTLVGNYPATQVIDHLVGDDGRAFNHSNAKINKGLNVFWDGANGTAIILYIDEWERLWAHFFNGTTITPAVRLHGPNEMDLEEDSTDRDWEYFENFRVLFINATGRQGDAIILWSKEDRDRNPPVTGSDTNDRLYGTYFDRSEAGSAQSASDPTVMYGFESEGTLLDFDNVNPLAGDDHVDSFGFVSDSLAETHAFDERDEDNYEWPNRFDDGSDLGLPPATRSGEPTTCVFIVWSKGQRDDTDNTGRRFHWLEFNLNQVGNALPTQTANGQNTIDTPTGLAGDFNVDQMFVVHNKCMLWVGRDSATGLEGLYLTCFSAGQAPTTIEFSAGVTDTTAQVGVGTPWVNTNAEVPLPANVYGGDHGLDSIYALFKTTGNGPERIAASKVLLSETDSQSSREIIQVDANNGNSISEFDGDKDPFAPMTLINRSADYIFIIWMQPTVTIPVGQLDGTVGLQRQIWTHGLQVDNGNRTLATSAAAGGPFPCPNQTLDVNFPSGRVWLQYEVADGMSDPRSGIQSNRNRINFAWHEQTDDDLSLHHNGLILTPGALVGDQPTAAYAITSSIGGVVAVGDTGYSFDGDNGMNPTILDLGTTAGDPLIYFTNNANNPTDDTATGAFDEMRVFGFAAADGTTTQLVSTNGASDDNVLDELIDGGDFELDDLWDDGGTFIRAKTTPTSTASGNHGGSVVHVFWQEARFGPDSRPSLMTRAFNKSAFDTAAVSTTFSSAHMPALSSAPTRLDGTLNAETHVQPNNHPDDEEIGPFTAFCGVSGSLIGIYFQTEGHFWYQEYNGSWLSAPELIDNAVPGTLFMGRDQRAYAFTPRRNSTFDNLGKTLTFHSKTLTGDDQGARRWFARIRN